MKKLLFVVLACAFLVTQGVAYQFNTNTKYGKLQQQCIKSDMKSCQAIVDGCKIKRIGNACEAQYSLGTLFITKSTFGGGDAEDGVIGLNLAKEAYKIGCKELKHKNTCELDRQFFEKVMYDDVPPGIRGGVEWIEETIHGEYD